MSQTVPNGTKEQVEGKRESKAKRKRVAATYRVVRGPEPARTTDTVAVEVRRGTERHVYIVANEPIDLD